MDDSQWNVIGSYSDPCMIGSGFRRCNSRCSVQYCSEKYSCNSGVTIWVLAEVARAPTYRICVSYSAPPRCDVVTITQRVRVPK